MACVGSHDPLPGQLCVCGRCGPACAAEPCAPPCLQLPCAPDGTPMLSLNGCFLNLPGTHLGAPGMAHFYRNPLDIVTSALW